MKISMENFWILGLKGLMILLVDDLLVPCPSGKYM